MPDITVMTPDPIVKKLLSLLTAEMPEEAVLRCDMTERSVVAAYGAVQKISMK